MKILQFAFLAVLAVLVVGCVAVPPQPIIDTKGVDMNQYQTDLAECQQLAAPVDQGATAAQNAVAGAVVMGVIGAIFGGRRGAAQLAGAGAVVGGVSGGANAVQTQRTIVFNCLVGRGYRPLSY